MAYLQYWKSGTSDQEAWNRPLIRWAPLPQCNPPPAAQRFGVPKAAANALKGTRDDVFVVVRWTKSFLGSLSRAFRSRSTISPIATSHEISCHPGSTPNPLTGLGRRRGTV